MTQLITVLFSLLVFHGIAMAEEAKEKGIFGKWDFEEVTSVEPQGLRFPESITIESTGPNEGQLMIKLPTQSEPRVYTFSKAKPTQHSSVMGNQDYYPIKEEMEIIYIDDTVLKMTWKFTRQTSSSEDLTRTTGVYTFVVHKDILVVTLIQDAPNENLDSSVLNIVYKRQ